MGGEGQSQTTLYLLPSDPFEVMVIKLELLSPCSELELGVDESRIIFI